MTVPPKNATPKPPPFDPPVAIADDGRRGSQVYRVPRRFNLPAVFVMTTLLAIVCGILKANDARTEVYMVLAIMTAVTCAAQIYAPNTPRLASTLGGVLVCCLFAVYVATMMGPRSRRYFLNPGELVCVLPSAALFGALLGYIVGTLAASVFLITDRFFGRRPPR